MIGSLLCRRGWHRWSHPFVLQLPKKRLVIRMCRRGCRASRVTRQDVWSSPERARRLGYVPNEPVDVAWADRVRELARSGGGAA
jgi:ribosomal protein L15E